MGSTGFEIAALVVGSVLLVALLCQLIPVLLYVRRMRPRDERLLPQLVRWPRICVFVPVRNGGADLRQALEHLLSLDYPDYQVRVVVDHPEDPAVAILDALLSERPEARLRYEVLREHPLERSLFCSALVQCFEQLDDSCELMTFAAADMNLPSSYLRDQAIAMRDPAVGSTLGNRWYGPQADSWGSIMRYLWNAAAVVPMWLMQISWGGASALRPQDVRRSGLLDSWKTSMVEDALIKSALSRLGLRLHFVPSLMVASNDAITLHDAANFLKRQLLWTRLYHPSWPLSLASACLITFDMLLPWLFAAWAWLAGYSQHAALFLAMAIGYWCLEAAMIALQDHAIRRVIAGNGQPMPRMGWGLKLRIFLVIPLSHVLHVAVMISAALARSIRWSGIDYHIVGKQVRMVRYEPALLE